MRGNADGGGCFPTGQQYPGIAHLLSVAQVGVADEYAPDLPMAALPVVSIDTETTGRDADSDRIVEIACVLRRPDGRIESHGWLVNPERPIPEEATAVHHISDADVANAPTFSQLVPELLTLLGAGVPLAYNASFDRTFILREFERAGVEMTHRPPALRPGVEWLDPLTWARHLQREERSKALGEVCARLGIEIGQAHRATDDAAAALQVHLRFLTAPGVPETYGAFVQEQRRLERVAAEARSFWRR